MSQINIRPGYSVEDTLQLFTLCNENWTQKKNSIEAFTQLITNGRPDPLAVSPSAWDTPLHWLSAVVSGGMQADPRFEWLLAQPGIDPDARNARQQTPLLLLTEENNRGGIKYLPRLLSLPQVDVDAADTQENTAIENVVNHGVKYLLALIAAGVNLNRSILHGNAELDVPAYYYHKESALGMREHSHIAEACLNHAHAIWDSLAAKHPFSCQKLRFAWKEDKKYILKGYQELDKRARARDAATGTDITDAQAAVTRLLNGGYLRQLFDPSNWQGTELEALELIRTTLRDAHQRTLASEIFVLGTQYERGLAERGTPLGDWQKRVQSPSGPRGVKPS